MNFQSDFDTQDAVFMFLWGNTGYRTMKTPETIEDGKRLVEEIKLYRGQIRGDAGRFRYEDRLMFLDEQIKKIERWFVE
jgi:hypothetical protein